LRKWLSVREVEALNLCPPDELDRWLHVGAASRRIASRGMVKRRYVMLDDLVWGNIIAARRRFDEIVVQPRLPGAPRPPVTLYRNIQFWTFDVIQFFSTTTPAAASMSPTELVRVNREFRPPAVYATDDEQEGRHQQQQPTSRSPPARGQYVSAPNDRRSRGKGSLVSSTAACLYLHCKGYTAGLTPKTMAEQVVAYATTEITLPNSKFLDSDSGGFLYALCRALISHRDRLPRINSTSRRYAPQTLAGATALALTVTDINRRPGPLPQDLVLRALKTGKRAHVKDADRLDGSSEGVLSELCADLRKHWLN
jgi:hypothetical protein